MENALAFVPYLLLVLMCPLMMLFMGHDHRRDHEHHARSPRAADGGSRDDATE